MSDKKYSARSMPVITRESYNVERAPALPNWLDEFAANLEKQSVQSKTKADKSIYDQISSIMGGKSKYSSVEAAVEDMKERSGMTQFLSKLKSEGQDDVGSPKTAQQQQDAIKLFQELPEIKFTLQNYLEDTHGNMSLPAIIEKIKNIYGNEVKSEADWDDPAFLTYVSKQNTEVKKKFPTDEGMHQNLGKMPRYTDEEIDPSNVDAFHSLMPTVIGK